MINEDKLLIARVQDLFSLCEKYCEPKFSAFLDGGEQAVLEDSFYFPAGFNTMMWGGRDGAERRILGVFPEWIDAKESDFSIRALHVRTKGAGKLTHRDYLGALMSLGIERAKTGDIVAAEDGAYIFVCEDIADYIKNGISKIGNCGVSIEDADLNEVRSVSPPMKKIEAVCASMRTDAVLAAAAGISRSEAAKLIAASAVKVNHRAVSDGSKDIGQGDVLSVRGFGRFIVASEGRTTRKGRVHITINKLI